MTSIDKLSAEELRNDIDWWRIYEDSFPAVEREPADVILNSILRDVGMALRARHAGVTFGLATTHILKNPPSVFLVYLAVDQSQRGLGTGGELLRNAWEFGAARLSQQGLSPVGLVWEVDSPDINAEDAEARRRRVAFFQRHGGQLLARPYLQPPVNGPTAIPMSLMFRPAEGSGLPTQQLVEDLTRAMYFEKYGAINEVDKSVLEGLLAGGENYT
jgi:GNAT superfamily N-acetyltransferase